MAGTMYSGEGISVKLLRVIWRKDVIILYLTALDQVKDVSSACYHMKISELSRSRKWRMTQLQLHL